MVANDTSHGSARLPWGPIGFIDLSRLLSGLEHLRLEVLNRIILLTRNMRLKNLTQNRGICTAVRNCTLRIFLIVDLTIILV